MSSAYERLLRPILFALDPERAHHLALETLRLASERPASLRFLHRFHPPQDPITLFGLNFPNRIGLAAGFDKNGVALPAWEALGFGFVEIGTVTAQPQPGNPKPRIFRYADQEALINRLGFNNEGADAVAARLAALRKSGRWPRIPIGINIGKSRIVPLEQANADYLGSFRALHPFADYLVLNVSSPNTPGLRSLQEHDALARLLSAVTDEQRKGARKPVLVKISPELSEDELMRVIEACEAHGISGIVATNTTLDHSSIARERDETGGLSGAPLRDKSTAMLRFLHTHTALPLVGVGGIANSESAREKLSAGAQLLQVYTGFVYRGPGLLRELAAGLHSMPNK